MFGNHIVELVPVACSRRRDGNDVEPLAMRCAVPKRVGISSSSYGTGPAFQNSIIGGDKLIFTFRACKRGDDIRTSWTFECPEYVPAHYGMQSGTSSFKTQYWESSIH